MNNIKGDTRPCKKQKCYKYCKKEDNIKLTLNNLGFDKILQTYNNEQIIHVLPLKKNLWLI